MAVNIRLKRMGRKNRPFYRIVVADARTRRDGDPVEQIGHYDPILRDKKNYVLKRERAAYWLSVGAQPSETIVTILKKEELWPREKAIAYWQEVKDLPVVKVVAPVAKVVEAAPVVETVAPVAEPVVAEPVSAPAVEEPKAEAEQTEETQG
jgi:small subunit ribosomal protein S16